MYPIEKKITIPPLNTKSTRFPFRNMKPGDSFTVPIAERNGLSSSSSTFADRQEPSWKFTTRKISEETVRIWRVK